MSYRSEVRKLSPKQPYTRTRESSSLVSRLAFSEYAYHLNCSHTSWVPNGYERYFAEGVYQTMTDVVVPGFHKRAKAGELFFNPMERLRHQIELPTGTGWLINSNANSCSSPAWKAEWDGRGPAIVVAMPMGSLGGVPVPLHVTPLSQNNPDVSQVMTEVATRLENSRGRADSNLFETLAEADQTVGMFERPISRMRRLLKEASNAKRNGKFAGYAANGVSNLYLAYRYGIKPILSDIEAITEGLKLQVGNRRKTTRAKASVLRSESKDLVVDTGISRVTLRYVTERSDTIRAMSLDDVDLSMLNNIGFTAKGLTTLPWELVPYSFVVDWFVNIGDYIGALTPAVGWNQVGSTMTHIRGILTTVRIVSWVNLQPSSYTFVRTPTGDCRMHFLGRSRFRPPSPGLVIKSDFRFDKLTRAADAFALLAQQFQRTFR